MKTSNKKSISISPKTLSLIERYRTENSTSFSGAVSALILQKVPNIKPEKLVEFQNHFNSLKDKLDPEMYKTLSKEIDNLWQM